MLNPNRLNRILSGLLLATFAAIPWTAPVIAQDCNGNGVPDNIDESGALYIAESNNSDIYRVPLTGGSPTLVHDTSVGGLYSGMAIDKVNGKIYVVNGSSNWIYSLNVDGTGFDGNFLASTGDVRNDISLRVPGQFLYTNGNCVFNRSVNGEPGIPGGCGLQFPLYLDTVTPNSYLIYGITSEKIQLITNNGGPSNQIQTVVNNVNIPGGMVYHNNQVFWTDPSTGSVMRADISCNSGGCTEDLNVTTIYTNNGTWDTLGIAIDRNKNAVYFFVDTLRVIYRCNLDGSLLTPFVALPPGQRGNALAILPASQDCNGNNTIDECDPDCNGDGIPDECEIDAGATDCNNNGIPDDCEATAIYSDLIQVNDQPTMDPTSVIAVDIDGNGIVDAVSASAFDNKIAWYTGPVGNSPFGPQTVINSVGDNPIDLEAADIDGDGDPDLVAFFTTNSTIYWFGNTTGEAGSDADGFDSGHLVATGTTDVRDVAVADLDGDGDADILATDGFSSRVYWYENTDGLGTFGALQLIESGHKGANVIAADLDGDGDRDVIVGGFIDTPIVWYENIDGEGNFGSRQIIYSVGATSSLSAADVDGDGDLDLVTSNCFGDRLNWYRNGGSGDFGPFPQTIATGVDCPGVVAMADVDNDGDLDAVAGVESTFRIYFNTDGLGSFSGPTIIANSDTFLPDAIDFADFNADGSIDFLVDGSNVYWIESLGFDCDGNGTPDDCDLAGGLFDCNGNGVIDTCDIGTGAAADCNANGIPDDCDFFGGAPDCNGDGILDACQLESNDCNGNGIPDDCELATGDCNSNGIPDDCDPDCNGDGTPDACQLAGNDCNSNGVIDDCDLLPTLDQINLDIGSTAATNIQTPREQTFTPSTSVLNGVQIGLADGSFDFPNDFITVSVFRGATLLGSATQEVFRPITGLTTFLFDAPIVTTPGEQLSLTVESDFQILVFFWEYTSTDTYPGGERIFAGTPSGDWRFATIELRPFSEDCNSNGTLDDCEPGFVDCNLNGSYDICELIDNDCNANGVPDDCDAAVLDCNNDGVPDDCQLAANDCNEDGIPDECNLVDSDCNNNGLVDQCEFEPQIDQSHLRYDSGGNFQLGNNAGQTFTPTFELLEAIEVPFLDNTAPGNSEVVTLRLLRGTDVLATVAKIVTAPVEPLTRFTFDEPIEVTPGELLEFQLNDTGFINFFWYQGLIGSTYDGGQGTFFGGPYNSDRSFQSLGRPQIFEDCNMNEVPDDCEIVAGDCNNNGILDDCESLPDCDGDGIPDECEIAAGDCNGDNIPDDCQLITDDCNSNGILDECEIAGGIFNYGAAPNIAIPDNNPTGITSVINVPFPGNINDVNVNLHINHTWQGDIIATLEHNGTAVTLINNSGGVSVNCAPTAFGYSANNFGTAGNPLVLDDSATVSIDCYDGPTTNIGIGNYAGPAMPNQPLAAFNGMNAGGEWTLTVSDPLVQELGTLISWSLDINIEPVADCNGNTIPDDCELNDVTFYALSDATDQILFLDEFGNTVRPAIDLPSANYRAVGYHAVAQVMLYSNLSTNEIVRVNLDGSDASTIISGSPQGQALDFEFPSTGTDFYYCTGNSGSLYRATLSGTTTTLIENVPLINNISGLALDEASNSIYFTDQATGRIWRRNLITSANVQIASGLPGPLEIELDRIGGKLYFTEFSGRSVRRMNLDGSGLETIYDSSGFAGGLELDIANGKVYFTDINTDQLLRCDFDGSNLQEIASVADVYRMDASIINTDCNGNGVPDGCDIPSSGDCCVTDNTPGCNVQSIQDCVCAFDSFCCNVEWDQLCVNQVESLGCGSCSTATFSNDCNANLIPDECETENDCNGNFIPDECENPLQGCGPGEECPDAIAIDAGTFAGDLGDNFGTTGDDDTCGNGGNGNNIDEWYRISVPFDTVVTITTCNGGTQFDSVLSVFDGCPIDGGVQIACNDDTFYAPPECRLGGGNLNRKSTISVNAFAGEEILIRVSPYNNLFNVQGGFGTQVELTVDYCFKGDLNEDYLVDATDVPLFVERLIDDTLVTVANRCDADMNDDGFVNGADLAGFIAALLGS